MSASVVEAKAALRDAMRAQLRRMTDSERSDGSARLAARLAAHPEFGSMRWVLGFVPLASEPDPWPALHALRARGGGVAVPRWDSAAGVYGAAEAPGEGEGGWRVGPHGVREPGPEAPGVPFERLDLVLVPGLAFDRSGCRLGRGRGFFDRILVRAVRARRWGIGWDRQVVESVPAEAHDMNLDAVVTPGAWIPVAARV